MQNLHALEVRQLGRDFAKVLFDLSPHLGPGKRNVILVVRHHHAGHLFADAIRQANHAKFFDIRRILVDLFDFVGINVLAVRVDDDLFRAAHQIEIAVVVEPAQIAGIKPAIYERFTRGFFIAKITEHHVRPARDYFADAGCVRFVDLDLHAGQRPAHRAGEQAILRTRHGQNRRSFRQSVAFENSEAQSLKVALHFVIQGGAAADEITDAAAHAFVNRIKENLAQIQRCLITHPGVESHQQIRRLADPLAALVQAVLDASMQQLPERRHADHAGDVAVLDGLRQMLAGQLW